MQNVEVGYRDWRTLSLWEEFMNNISHQKLNALHLATNYTYCGFMCVINCPMMLKDVKVLDLVINNLVSRWRPTVHQLSMNFRPSAISVYICHIWPWDGHPTEKSRRIWINSGEHGISAGPPVDSNSHCVHLCCLKKHSASPFSNVGLNLLSLYEIPLATWRTKCAILMVTCCIAGQVRFHSIWSCTRFSSCLSCNAYI